MGYWVEVQLRTIMISVMYKSNFIVGKMILRRVLLHMELHPLVTEITSGDIMKYVILVC